MDLILRGGTVVTVNARREVLPRADVWVKGGRIVGVGRNLPVPDGPHRLIDATGAVVIPGLIHGHVHTCQTLFRNRADGLELLDWLSQRIWPFEAAHDEKSLRVSADLSFAELIRSGATAALDMGTVHHTDVIFEAARACGFRLTSGKAMMDAGAGVPAGLKETTQASLDESVRLLKAWHGREDDRLRYAFAPRFVLSCTDELMREVGRLARAHGARVHTHASENRVECATVRERTGKDNIEHLNDLGLAGPFATFAHCVWVSEREQKILKDTRTVVCHCPSSNLKLASGIARVPALLSDGVGVCLGADGAPCNNNLDMFQEMRLAALLHKPQYGPTAMAAEQVLEMATLGGARALGLEEEVGSIEKGKRADLTVVRLEGAHALPGGDDVVAQLVHSGRASDVRDVVIDGRVVMQDRTLLTLDEAAILAAAQRPLSNRFSRKTYPSQVPRQT